MTVFESYVAAFNKSNTAAKIVNNATNLFKNSVNVGEAIVNILSNTGIAGFKFHIPETERVNMESEITDHYTDTNTAVQDHIARRPITITLSGLQGEYFYSVNQIEDFLAKVVPTISLIKQFLPKLDDASMKLKSVYNKNLSVTSGTGTATIKNISDETNTFNNVDLFKIFQDLYKLKSAQTRAFLFFEAMWKSNAVFSVETTWKRYDNMLIQKVTPVRDKNADITDFSLTLKQINFTQSLYTDLNNVAELTRQQLMQKVNKGVTKGEEVKTTNV